MHPHFTRLQRSQDVMEPNVKSAFEQILSRLDSIDERCGRMEKGAADSDHAREERDAAVKARVVPLEKAMGTQSASSSTAVAQIQAREERATALDDHITSLEKVCNTQSHTTVLFDVRAQDFEQRIAEAEMRMGDLELIRVFELRDERDERVSVLESAAAVLEEWRPYIEGMLDDLRLGVRSLKQQWDGSLLGTSSAPPGLMISPVRESTTARPPTAG